MLKGLQVGFVDSTSPTILHDLGDLGVQLFRCDMQSITTQQKFQALTNEIIAARLRPFLIIRPDQVSWLLPNTSLDIEVFNEPNLKGMSPTVYTEYLNIVCKNINPSHTIWGGVISNLDEKSLEWLRMGVRSWPTHVNISVHRYPIKGKSPEQAQPGFTSRVHEIEVLKSMIGVRKWGVSEFGYHTADWVTGWCFWKKRHRLTDAQVATHAQWEWKFWASQGAEFAIWHQLNGNAKYYW